MYSAAQSMDGRSLIIRYQKSRKAIQRWTRSTHLGLISYTIPNPRQFTCVHTHTIKYLQNSYEACINRSPNINKQLKIRYAEFTGRMYVCMYVSDEN